MAPQRSVAAISIMERRHPIKMVKIAHSGCADCRRSAVFVCPQPDLKARYAQLSS